MNLVKYLSLLSLAHQIPSVSAERNGRAVPWPYGCFVWEWRELPGSFVSSLVGGCSDEHPYACSVPAVAGQQSLSLSVSVSVFQMLSPLLPCGHHAPAAHFLSASLSRMSPVLHQSEPYQHSLDKM